MTWTTTTHVDVFAQFSGLDDYEEWVLLSAIDGVRQIPKGAYPRQEREITRIHLKSGEEVFIRHTTAEFWEMFQAAVRRASVET